MHFHCAVISVHRMQRKHRLNTLESAQKIKTPKWAAQKCSQWVKETELRSTLTIRYASTDISADFYYETYTKYVLTGSMIACMHACHGWVKVRLHIRRYITLSLIAHGHAPHITHLTMYIIYVWVMYSWIIFAYRIHYQMSCPGNCRTVSSACRFYGLFNPMMLQHAVVHIN